MEIILVVILLISLLSLPLQMTFFYNKKVQWIYLAAIAVGIYAAYPYAIEESYVSIQKIMTNPSILNDFATLVIAESLFGCLLSLFQIKLFFGQNIKKWWQYASLFVGVAFLISIYFLEVLIFINLPGIDFSLLAIIITVLVPALILSVKYFVKWLTPENYLRTEMKFFLHLIQLLLSIILSVIILKLPVNTVEYENSLQTLSLVAVIVVFFVVTGYFYNTIKSKKTWK